MFNTGRAQMNRWLHDNWLCTDGVEEVQEDNRVSENGLSIQDAKQLLSKRYDVEVDNIEIILKG